jgi:hypothetical protein
MVEANQSIEGNKQNPVISEDVLKRENELSEEVWYDEDHEFMESASSEKGSPVDAASAEAELTNKESVAKKVTTNKKNGKDLPVKRRFVLNIPKDNEALALDIQAKLDSLSSTPIGEVEIEDVLMFLLEEKFTEDIFEQIRDRVFERKLENARVKFNKEKNKNYSLTEFLAQGVRRYLN